MGVSLFKVEIVSVNDVTGEVSRLAFVYDKIVSGVRRNIRMEFVHDKENRNYDHYYYKMRDEILNG